jgi:uncharacterized protein GlcG (DUF336 family)
MKTAIQLTGALALSACALTLHAQQPASGGSPMSMPPAMTANPPPPGVPQPLPRSPSMAVALKMARAAIGACRGYHIGVTVLDAAGYPKLTYIPDGSHGFHAFMSFKKANTALKFRMPSGDATAAMKRDSKVAAEFRAGGADFISFAGGLPLLSNGKLIGAVGVSGAEPSAKDEACGKAAIEAVGLSYRE